MVALESRLQSKHVHVGDIVNVDGNAKERLVASMTKERTHHQAIGALGDVGNISDGVIAANDEDGEDVDNVEGGLLFGDEFFGSLESKGLGGFVGEDAGSKGALGASGASLLWRSG